MIKSIVIKGFFSFSPSAEPIVLHAHQNILIGINGTGKSNFIKAINLLYEAIAGQGLEKILTKWGGFSNIANFGQENIDSISITYEFDKEVIASVLDERGHRFPNNPFYEIKVHKLGNAGGYYLSEDVFNESTNGRNTSPFIYLKVSNGRGVISKRQGREINLRQAAFKEQELVLRQISEPNEYFPLFTLKTAIEELVVYNYFDTTYDSKIRQLSPFYSDLKLLPNGENLTHLLNFLNGNSTVAYDTIIDLLRNTINANFQGLVFSQPTAGKTLLALKENNLHRAVPIEHISDGTLRFLLLLAIFYNPRRGKLICIDEPEIGLHPDMIRTIAEGIKYAAQHGTQVIVATHSPLLLNAFDLEDLLIFEKDATNSTVVSTKREEDFGDWEGDFLVGQMWLNGQIGGTRW